MNGVSHFALAAMCEFRFFFQCLSLCVSPNCPRSTSLLTVYIERLDKVLCRKLTTLPFIYPS